MIQRGRNRKSEVASIIAPVDGYRGSLKKKGLKPKNHIQENTKNLKQNINEYRKKEQADVQSKKEHNTKLKQFTNVKSRLYNYTKRPQTCYGPRQDDLIEDKFNTMYEDDEENYNSNNIQTYELPGNENSIIKKNIKKAWYEKSQTHERPQTATSRFGGETYKAKGKVPSYLVNRQQEWKKQEEDKVRQKELRKVPPGTKLLPEGERLATLDQLNYTKKEIMNTVESLPISMRTMALRDKKVDLENKLIEVEAAIKLFSKENVYVAI
jgi:hypothetical protein